MLWVQVWPLTAANSVVLRVGLCSLCPSTTKSQAKEMQAWALRRLCWSRRLATQMVRLFPTLNFLSFPSACTYLSCLGCQMSVGKADLFKCLSLEPLPSFQNKETSKHSETSELFIWKTGIKILYLYFFPKQSCKWALSLSQNLLRELLLILYK